jgi:hypothetical protein
VAELGLSKPDSVSGLGLTVFFGAVMIEGWKKLCCFLQPFAHSIGIEVQSKRIQIMDNLADLLAALGGRVPTVPTHRHAAQPAGRHAGVASNDNILVVNQDGACKSERIHAVRDLADLLAAVRARIPRIGLQLLYSAVLDLKLAVGFHSI